MPPKAFSRYTLEDRLHYLAEKTGLSLFEIKEALETPAQNLVLAEAFIEAPFGYFALPLGLVKSLTMNGKTYCVPLAIEETSVVAALNKTASWVECSGRLTARINGDQKDQTVIGQIQIATLKNPERFQRYVRAATREWIDLANKGPAATLFKRGGGVTDINLRLLSRQKNSGVMGVLHVRLNPCEAMGANQVTQVCEFLKPYVEAKTHEKVTLCILSNLTDQKLITANLVLENIDPELGHKIEEASHFAICDPYRAATHNKGIMNGIDAVVIATGNDWRAVEAGLHSYGATKDETSPYAPLATWQMQGADLVGTFKGPIAVGTVGGVTRRHPTAQLVLKCLGNPSSNELSCLIASVGLLQNLGALRALVSEGIIQGHMGLHIKNMIHRLEATPEQKENIRHILRLKLQSQKHISDSDAKKALAEIAKVA